MKKLMYVVLGLFVLSGQIMNAQGWDQEAKIVASDCQVDANFGGRCDEHSATTKQLFWRD